MIRRLFILLALLTAVQSIQARRGWGGGFGAGLATGAVVGGVAGAASRRRSVYVVDGNQGRPASTCQSRNQDCLDFANSMAENDEQYNDMVRKCRANYNNCIRQNGF